MREKYGPYVDVRLFISTDEWRALRDEGAESNSSDFPDFVAELCETLLVERRLRHQVRREMLRLGYAIEFDQT